MLSIRDFYPEFSQAFARGNSRWQIAGLPVELTPICVRAEYESEGDAPAMLHIFADERVIAHIENAGQTSLAEIVHIAQELHVTPGQTVRFAVRDASRKMLGVMNCAQLPEGVWGENPGLVDRILGAQVRFSGELAFYHARGQVDRTDLVLVRHGERNELAEETKSRWLRTLQSRYFRRAFSEFSGEIETCAASVEAISNRAAGNAVLCSKFAMGFPVLVRLLCELAHRRGVAEGQIKFLLFTDTLNRQSLRMLLPFGAHMEGFCWYPNPDGSRRPRIVLSQSPAGIESFLNYYHVQLSERYS